METKVPARGKALVATDISIAIPEGTYARVGNFLLNFGISEFKLFFILLLLFLIFS